MLARSLFLPWLQVLSLSSTPQRLSRQGTAYHHGPTTPKFGLKSSCSRSPVFLWLCPSSSSSPTGEEVIIGLKRLPRTTQSLLSGFSSSVSSCGVLVQPRSTKVKRRTTTRICGAGLALTTSDDTFSKTTLLMALSAVSR